MADENRMDNDGRTYEGRTGAAPVAERAGDRSRTSYSPYSAAAGSPDTHMGGTQPIPMKKGLFDGISVAQVIAASAAAATSMLLASRIGIAGSVIGAAVSSMVTVICSQLYRNALDASARKLKAKQMDHACEQDALRGYASAEGASSHDEGATGAPRIRIAPTKLQARAAAERSASKRKVAVVSVLIAIAAVAASAGVIMLTTSGQGLGVKAPNVFGSRPTESQPASETNAPVDESAEAPATQPDPDASANATVAPEGNADAGGTVGTDSGGTAGNASSGTTGEGDVPQQSDPATGSGDSTSGKTDGAETGADGSTSAPDGKKPTAGTGGATGVVNAAAFAFAGAGADIA